LLGLCGDPLPEPADPTCTDQTHAHLSSSCEVQDADSFACCSSSGTDDPDESPTADLVARLADVLADADTPSAPGQSVSYEALAHAALVHLGLI
jgi:hypothetical protein